MIIATLDPSTLAFIVTRWSGHWDSNPEPCANLALTPLIRRLLYRLSYAPKLRTECRKDLNVQSLLDHRRLS